jgi:uncharacterized membrane protein
MDRVVGARLRSLFWVFVGAAFLIPAAGRAASFTPLGTLAGYQTSFGNAVSADGTTVTGTVARTTAPFVSESFRWTSTGGMTNLGPTAAGTIAAGVSGDGSVIVGSRGSTSQGFVWTSSGITSIPPLPGTSSNQAVDVSDDGSIVLGQASGSPARQWIWTQSGGTIELGLGSTASVDNISGDGSTFGGAQTDLFGGITRPVVWSSHGVVTLPGVPGGNGSGSVTDLNVDGSIAVGYGSGAGGTGAFRWQFGVGAISLGDLPGGGTDSRAFGVSGDGSVIIGFARSTRGQEAFVWDAADGMRSLKDVLTGDFGLDLTGWTLSQASAISADGRAITGWGTNPSGVSEAWVAVIPEPATALLLTLGLAGLQAARPKRR